MLRCTVGSLLFFCMFLIVHAQNPQGDVNPFKDMSIFELNRLSQLEDSFPDISDDAINGRLRQRTDYRSSDGSSLTDRDWQFVESIDAKAKKRLQEKQNRGAALRRFETEYQRLQDLRQEALRDWSRGDTQLAEAKLRVISSSLGTKQELLTHDRMKRLRARVEGDLAGVLSVQGRYEEAKVLSQTAVATWEGLSHDSLAWLSQRVDQLRAATIKRRLGEHHAAAKSEAAADLLTRRLLARPPSMQEQLTEMYGGKLEFGNGLDGSKEKLPSIPGIDQEKLEAELNKARSALEGAKNTVGAVFNRDTDLNEARLDRERGNLLGALSKLANIKGDAKKLRHVALEFGMVYEQLGDQQAAVVAYRRCLDDASVDDQSKLIREAASSSLARLVVASEGLPSALKYLSECAPIGTRQLLAAQLGFDLADRHQGAVLAIATEEVEKGLIESAIQRLRTALNEAAAIWDNNVLNRLQRDFNKTRGEGDPKTHFSNPYVDIEQLEDAIANHVVAGLDAGVPGYLPSFIADEKRLARARAALGEALLARIDELNSATKASVENSKNNETEALASEAFSLLVEALAVQRIHGDPQLYRTATRLAGMLAPKGGRLGDAEALYREAIDMLEHERRVSIGDESDRARYFSTLMTAADPYGGLLRTVICSEAPVSKLVMAFEEAERGRGRGLLDLVGGNHRGDAKSRAAQRLVATNDKEGHRTFDEIERRESTATKAIDDAASRLRKLPSAKGNDAERSRLIEAIRIASESERNVRLEYRALLTDDLSASLAQPWSFERIASALLPTELLLFYEIGTKDGYVAVVRKEIGLRWLPLKWNDGSPVNRATVEATVAKLNKLRTGAQSVGDGNASDEREARELAGALVPAAMREEIAGCARVLIVPDGALHALPFESLRLPPKNEQDNSVSRWIDAWPPVVYGVSCTAMLHGRSASSSATATGPILVAVGNPSGGSSASDAKRGTDTENNQLLDQFNSGAQVPLPGAEAEVQALRRIIEKKHASPPNPVVSLLREEATLDRLVGAAQKPKFLHIGAHGFAVSGRLVNESSIILARGERLRLTDLMFSWPGKLAGTKVVTLSACQTASGRLERRDGVVALLWGFLSAGAETVVATRWSVDDNATALLTERFYRNLLGDFDTARQFRGTTLEPGRQMPRLEALSEAQKWLRSLDAAQATAELDRLRGPDANRRAMSGNPYADAKYWAAFQLVGSPD